MNSISSLDQLFENLSDKDKTYLLLYKMGSESSDCAYKNVSEALKDNEGIRLLSADVTTVRDIHPVFGVSSVPAMLRFDGMQLKNVVKGCHPASYYQALFQEALFQSLASENEGSSKNVTVYTTPTCSWCNTLKQWLRKNRVYYTEVDISRDENAARDLVSRSGQQGVPQTDINGRIVVGFDQQKLKELLGI